MAEPDRVVTETISVGRGGDRDLQADLYRPPAPNGCGVLLIHGGGFGCSLRMSQPHRPDRRQTGQKTSTQ